MAVHHDNEIGLVSLRVAEGLRDFLISLMTKDGSEETDVMFSAGRDENVTSGEIELKSTTAGHFKKIRIKFEFEQVD